MTWLAVDEWLRFLPHDTDELAVDVAWSPVFTEQPSRPGRAGLDREWRWGGAVSWLGGPALLPLPEWPRRPDGTPLAHVASISLHEAAVAAAEEDKAAWPEHDEGLPDHGWLEVFHDLSVYGWDAGDRDGGSWLVRWVPEAQRPGFAEPPPDLDTPGAACQAGMLLRGWSARPSGDFLSDRGQNSAAEHVQQEFQRAWSAQRNNMREALPGPVTHVYGHSQVSTAPAVRVLRDVLPLQEGDRHRLVLDVESTTHLAGWFGDSASLEVWMRQSDVAARRFDRAWCLTRTD